MKSVEEFRDALKDAGATEETLLCVGKSETTKEAQKQLKLHLSKKRSQKMYSDDTLSAITQLTTDVYTAKKTKPTATAGKSKKEDSSQKLKSLEAAIRAFEESMKPKPPSSVLTM